VSPEVGELDQSAFDNLMQDDPEQALELLAGMAGATDQELARLARRLAGRLVLDLTRIGKARGRGTGKLVRAPATVDGGDLDIDASLDRLVTARAERRPAALDELVATAWRRPATAICLLVDRSGSMNGARLVTAALAAAVCSWRAPADFAVLAFGDRVVSIKDLHDTKAPAQVVGEVMTLRGHGTTDVELALRAAGRQLAGSQASRKLTILLSDAEATIGGDPTSAARSLDELAIVAPHDAADAARALARTGGARVAEVDGPMSVLGALRTVVE
jgi:Mg-chelatase subunit ChlD